MLKIENLSVRYGNNREASVQDFNLTLGQGEIVCIVGESGSGKTTVLRSILKMLPAGGNIEKGTIYLEDRCLTALGKKEWMALRGKTMSIIFQDCGSMLNPIQKIGTQYVEYIRRHTPLSKKEAREKAGEMLRRMHLPEAQNVLDSYPFQLSGGMRQRVGIAMAMTFEPKLLLADEPTSALDVTTQAQIVRQMMALREDDGTSIMMVTHNLGVAAHMADRIVVMKAGRIVEEGPCRTVLDHPQQAYTQALIQAVPEIGGRRFV